MRFIIFEFWVLGPQCLAMTWYETCFVNYIGFVVVVWCTLAKVVLVSMPALTSIAPLVS